MSPTHIARIFKPLRAAFAVACGAAYSISIGKPSFLTTARETVPATAILSIFSPLLVPLSYTFLIKSISQAFDPPSLIVGTLITVTSPTLMSIIPVRLVNATSIPSSASSSTTPVAFSSFL